MTSRSPSVADAVTELADTFAGQLLQPTDAGYEDARRVHNGLVDKRPALIARCRGLGRIVDAVNLARTLNLEVAVRGGGHNVAGRATVDGGLMIDLSPMKGIHVDPKARTARAQGGVTWAEFNRETQLHGLATTGGVVSSTGIAGLTLGGGLGWLMGKYGLALDNLLSVDLVTADGKVLRASQDEHADLFWAVRGGGGNFGVAASWNINCTRWTHDHGGLVAHPFERAGTCCGSTATSPRRCPTNCTVWAGLIHAPDGSGAKLAAMVVGHCGPLDAGEAAMRPLKAFGSPAMDAIGPMPYCQLNAMLDAAYPKGALNYWKSSFLAQLSDEAIDTMIDVLRQVPVADGPDAPRAHPRRGDPGRGRRHRLSPSRGRLQPARAVGMDGAGR